MQVKGAKFVVWAFLVNFCLLSHSFGCLSLVLRESWIEARQSTFLANQTVASLEEGLSIKGPGFGIVNLQQVISDALGRELFDLVGTDGRHTIYHGDWNFPDAFSAELRNFLKDYAFSVVELVKSATRRVDPHPLKMKLMQLRRYTKGAPAPSENNNSDILHVDSIYLRTFMTVLGQGLIVGERKALGSREVKREIELARAALCAFSGKERSAALGGAIDGTLHRGRTVGGVKDARGMTRGSVYESDRLSLIVDFVPDI